VGDFRSISLIHSLSLSKLIAKVLSTRLAPVMRSAKPKCLHQGPRIHDNFRTVQSTAKLLHVRRGPMVLLKIDIAKAFDTLNWAFLPELLCHMGFSRRWVNWVSILLSTESTKILVNGQPGCRIPHARGLRSPFSPSVCDLHGGSKLLGCASKSSGSIHSAPVAKYSTSFVTLRGRSGHLCGTC
jgi:hypothetical protein